MAYRISFSGYDRNKLRALFGSGDAEAIARLHSAVDADEYGYETDRDECKAIISRVIHEGTPFSDCEYETHVHTWAASLLAQDQQEWLWTDCDYHWVAVPSFRKEAYDIARPEVRAFITGMNTGVTMFGQQFSDIHSPYYASFTHANVTRFHAGLEELKSEIQPIDELDSEKQGLLRFVDDLMEYLGQIKESHKDCWFMTG